MAIHQRAETAKPWLALADATALLISFVLAVGLLVWLRGETVLPLVAYGVVSLLAFLLYWNDKRKACTDSRRMAAFASGVRVFS